GETERGAGALGILLWAVTEPRAQLCAPTPVHVFGPGKEPSDMLLVPASHSAPRSEVVSSAAIVADTPFPSVAVYAIKLRPHAAVSGPAPAYPFAMDQACAAKSKNDCALPKVKPAKSTNARSV